jgi:dihydroneopterin aldolase
MYQRERDFNATVFVQGLLVDAQIGVHASEVGIFQPLSIDVELDASIVFDESLESSVDYEMVARAARALVADRHIRMVETLASELAYVCLGDSRVHRVRVTVRKLGAIEGASAGGVIVERIKAREAPVSANALTRPRVAEMLCE